MPLSHPTPGATLSLAVDASDSHVGGVLQQLENRAWRPLAFFSQKLSPAQSRYSTFDRELLAAYSAVRHFRFLLEGRKFRILTDHKPLIAAMTRVTPPWSARQQRHLSFLAEFTSDFRHTSGHANVVAATLSCPPPEKSNKTAPAVAEPCPPVLHANKLAFQPEPASLCAADGDRQPPSPVPPPLDFQAVATAQRTCPKVVAMSNSPSLQIVSRAAGDTTILGDISTGTFRPLVPPAFRQEVIRRLHEVHHPGVRATTRLVKASFCWPKMGRDIAAAARACMGCQLGKIHRHVKLQPEHIPVPRRRFAHLHVDLVGPLPSSGGYTHLFTMVDRTTRWPEAVPVSATSAADCAAALFSGWVQRFGLPAAITSDRGPQFTSAVWAALCRLLNIQHIPTTAYHPQSNGLVEISSTAERHPTCKSGRRRLDNTPALGYVRDQVSMARRNRLFTRGSSVWSTAHLARTVSRRRRGTIAVLPLRSTGDPDRADSTPNNTSFSSCAARPSRGATTCPPRLCSEEELQQPVLWTR